MTDDPGTPGPGGWEINVATLADVSKHERWIEAPRVDVNYGVGTRIQLKWEAPLVFLTRENATHVTPGAAAVGVKWRFFGDETGRIAWSIYPQMGFNTASASVTNGVGEEGRTLVLPTQLTASVGALRINGEVGRVFQSVAANSWMYGVALASPWWRTLGFVAELHGEKPDAGLAELTVNGAVRPALTKTTVLLVAVGRTLRSTDREGHHHVYVGLQVRLPSDKSRQEDQSN